MNGPLTAEVTCLKADGCGVCGEALTGRRRRWCSDECRNHYYVNHIWNLARDEAHHRAGGTCVGCGKRSEEVDHIQERKGFPLFKHSCLHHQENLRALCHNCHVNRRTLLDIESLPFDDALAIVRGDTHQDNPHNCPWCNEEPPTTPTIET